MIENIVEVCQLITRHNNLILITNATSPKLMEIADSANLENVEFIKTWAHIMQRETEDHRQVGYKMGAAGASPSCFLYLVSSFL